VAFCLPAYLHTVIGNVDTDAGASQLNDDPVRRTACKHSTEAPIENVHSLAMIGNLVSRRHCMFLRSAELAAYHLKYFSWQISFNIY
jgi:hypothetical protein